MQVIINNSRKIPLDENVRVRNVHGTKCQGTKCPWDEMSGTKCPGTKCPWDEMSASRSDKHTKDYIIDIFNT